MTPKQKEQHTNRLGALQKDMRNAVRAKDHVVVLNDPVYHRTKITQYGRCFICGLEVQIDTNPNPNNDHGASIHGSALLFECKKLD